MNKSSNNITAQGRLVYFVSCAVNQEAPDKAIVEETDLKEVYDLSAAQMLSAAVAFALEKTIPLPYVLDQVKKIAIRRLTLFEVEYAAISREFEQAGVRYLPLKGILLKNDYPRSAIREMTDIDILVDSFRMDDVRQIMKRLGYSGGDYQKDHDVVFTKPPFFVFEMHHRLFDRDQHPLYDSYYQSVWERAVPVQGTSCGFRMTDEDFYAYLICHMYKHYQYTGTGLRSLLDIYVFNRKHGEALDRAYLDAELKKLELTDFEREMRLLADKAFTGAALSQQEQTELERFAGAGVFGVEELAVQHSAAKYFQTESGKKSIVKYYLRRAFVLPEKDLEKYFPVVYRHRILYPLLPFYRLGKSVIKHPKRLVSEFKTVKRLKKQR